MNGIIEIVKPLEQSGLLTIGVRETIKNESKEQKGGFLSMLLGTLGASLLGNQLTGTGVILLKMSGREVMRTGEGTIRAEQSFESNKYLINNYD